MNQPSTPAHYGPLRVSDPLHSSCVSASPLLGLSLFAAASLGLDYGGGDDDDNADADNEDIKPPSVSAPTAPAAPAPAATSSGSAGAGAPEPTIAGPQAPSSTGSHPVALTTAATAAANATAIATTTATAPAPTTAQAVSTLQAAPDTGAPPVGPWTRAQIEAAAARQRDAREHVMRTVHLPYPPPEDDPPQSAVARPRCACTCDVLEGFGRMQAWVAQRVARLMGSNSAPRAQIPGAARRARWHDPHRSGAGPGGHAAPRRCGSRRGRPTRRALRHGGGRRARKGSWGQRDGQATPPCASRACAFAWGVKRFSRAVA